MTKRLSAAAGLALAVLAGPALAQGQDEAGTILSSREREQVVRQIRLPDGRVVLQTENYGFPAAYGLGDVRGKSSSVPVVNGRNPSVLRSTPSNGIVPGQSPE